MSSRSRRLVKLLVPTLSSVRAVLEWMLTLPKSRKQLAVMGIRTMKDYIDVRVGLDLPADEDFKKWLQTYGFGLVTEPSDIYEYMKPIVDDFPVFELLSFNLANPRVTGSVDVLTMTGIEAVGFMTKKLPSGARFYYSPYEQETDQAKAWLSLTARHMGYDLQRL